MRINLDHEFCAARIRKIRVKTQEYQVTRTGSYKAKEKKTKHFTFYGGADACQGDSGGPL